MQLLKQSTTITIQLGPFLDETDGKTPETGLTISSTDVYLSKGGAAFANPSDTNAATHDRAGWYRKQLNATDTATLGKLIVEVQESGALPVWHEFMVVPAHVYDGLISGTDNLEVDAKLISGSSGAADSVEANIGNLDASIAGLNDPTDLEIADAVWDEILTGGTHNIATSAGRRLRNLQDFGVYEGGAIWIDTVNGTGGTVDYENGTVNNPVDTIADALTLAVSVGLSAFYVLPGSSITLGASVDGYEFRGYGYTITLNGQSVSGTLFRDAVIAGNDDGSNVLPTIYENCVMQSNTIGQHILNGCRLTGDIVLAEAANHFWDQCYSGVAGTGTPSVDFQAAVETKKLSVRHYSGGLEFKNFGNLGTHTASVEGFGQVVLNASCDGGTIAIRGMLTVTDNAAGAVTLSDNARIDTPQINAEADQALTDYDGPTKAEMDAGFAGISSPTEAAIAAAVWDRLLWQHTTGDSAGKYLSDLGNASIPSAEDNADAIWDRQTVGHSDAGSFGVKVKDLVDAPSANVDDYKADVSGLATDAHLDTIQALLDTTGVELSDAAILATAQKVLQLGVGGLEDTADAYSLVRLILFIMKTEVLEISEAVGSKKTYKADGSLYFEESISLDSDALPITGVGT